MAAAHPWRTGLRASTCAASSAAPSSPPPSSAGPDVRPHPPRPLWRPEPRPPPSGGPDVGPHPPRLRIEDDVRMAYDEDLANRIRQLTADEAGVTEKRMFGGLAFRVDPDDTDALLAEPHARPFEMRGREMRGWLRVDPDGVRTSRELEPWV